MSTKTITELADVREGDTVTYSYRGHEVTGVAWQGMLGLAVGGADVDWFGTSARTSYKFVSATREIPDLPLSVGSVIVDVVTEGGVSVPWMVRGVGAWYSPNFVPRDSSWIVSWKPGKVVEA